jgi:adenylate cyclase
MKFEFERKFLLKNAGWEAAIVGSRKLSDGLLSNSNGNKVRVRIADRKGSIAIKGPKTDLSRAELEYEIPLADAEFMLRDLCGADVCNKTRYLVSHDFHVWHVDVYGGVLEGLVVAEIELDHANENFVIPDWAGQEVTDDPRYGKWAVLAGRTANGEVNDSIPSGQEDGKIDTQAPRAAAPRRRPLAWPKPRPFPAGE